MKKISLLTVLLALSACSRAMENDDSKVHLTQEDLFRSFNAADVAGIDLWGYQEYRQLVLRGIENSLKVQRPSHDPLAIAAQYGDYALVVKLIDYGAKPDYQHSEINALRAINNPISQAENPDAIKKIKELFKSLGHEVQ